MLARDDLGQEVTLLGFGTALDDDVADHPDAEYVVVVADRDPSPRELLSQNDSFHLAESGAAVGDRPRHGQQLILRQQRPPLLDELFASLLVERSHPAPVDGQVLCQEGLDLLAVDLGLVGVGGIHRRAPLREMQISLSALADLVPRAAVGTRFTRQPEHPVADDVALHL